MTRAWSQGPVKILEDKQSSQRVMALALSEILPTGCKLQMDREASKIAPKNLQKYVCFAHQCAHFLCFESKPATLPLHIARSQPVQSNCCQCDVKGSSFAKGKTTNKSSAGSYLQHVLFWLSSFSNHWYHLMGFVVAQLPRSPIWGDRILEARQMEMN